MAATATPEVMESIEAKAPDQDVEMEDRQDDADADADVDADAGADGEVDADGEPDEEPDGRRSRDQTDMLNTMSKIESFLRNFTEEWVAPVSYLSRKLGFANSEKRSGEDICAPFQRMPNRRVLPDYFEVIKEPIAFSHVRVSRLEAGDGARLPAADNFARSIKYPKSFTTATPSLSRMLPRSSTMPRCTIGRRRPSSAGPSRCAMRSRAS